MDNYETLMMVFRNKKADGETRTHNPNWWRTSVADGHTGCGMIFGYYNRVIRFVELDTFRITYRPPTRLFWPRAPPYRHSTTHGM